MNNWNQDRYIKAWNYASKIHNDQLLPSSDIPYINHIGLVAMEGMTAISNGNIDNPDLLIQCALLHDSIEDTPSTYDDILNAFGLDVADGVLALSKNKNLQSKQEQMEDSLNRIMKQPKEIWMVKISDRITNLQPPPKKWDKIKINSYREEAKQILDKLSDANDFLSNRLQVKITNYKQYI